MNVGTTLNFYFLKGLQILCHLTSSENCFLKLLFRTDDKLVKFDHH